MTPLLLLLTLLCAACTFVAGENFNTEYSFTDCNGCLSFALYSCSGAACRSFDCGTRTAADGTRGQLAIMRSAKFNDFIIANAGFVSGSRYAIAGDDSANEGVWAYSRTGEVFYSGGAPVAFAYVNWGGAEPNDVGGEDQMNFLWFSTAWRWNDNTNGFLEAGVVCSFERIVGADQLTHGSGVSAAYGLSAQTKYARFEVFPDHQDQLTAFRRCEGQLRTDPNTGKQIGGTLAVLWTKMEFDTVLALLQNNKSDVRFHSSDTGFGVWLGANASGTGEQFNWMPEGTRSTQLLQLRASGGGCPSYVYCNFGTASTWSNNRGLVLVTTNAVGADQWKYGALGKNNALPYVCRWSFNPNASVILPVPASMPRFVSATDPLGTQLRKLTVLTARYFSEWRTVQEARGHCWGHTETNEAGDTVRGLSGVVFDATEYALLAALINGSGMMSADAALSELPRGVFLDILTTGDVAWGTSLATLRDRAARGLVFNRGGKLPYTPQTLSWEYRMYDAGSGDCAASNYCPPLRKYDDDSAGTPTTLSFDGEYINSMNSGRRRPYVCVFRFPRRARIMPWLTVEFHSFPMTYADAATVCASRTIKMAHPSDEAGRPLATITGAFTSVPRSALVRVQRWLSDVASGGLAGAALRTTGPVRLGGRANGLCDQWHRSNEELRWRDCDVPIEFICMYRHPATRSLTVTADNTATAATRTGTEDKSMSVSTSPDDTATAATASTSPTADASATESQSHSVTADDSASASQSHSVTADDTASLSLSPSLSEPTATGRRAGGATQTLSEDSATASETASRSPSPSLSESASLSLTDTRSVVPTPTESQTASADESRTNSHPTASAASAGVGAGATISLSASRPTADETASATVSVSATRTIQILDRHIRSAEIRALQDISSVASLFTGGAIAVQRSRLEAADALAKCGDPHQRYDDAPPDFMSAPLQLQIGDESVATRYQRGIIVGNVVALLAATAILYVVGYLLGVARFRNFRRGLEAVRLPGICMVPVAVLTAPSVEAAGILLVHDDGPIARLLGIAGLFFMVGVAEAVCIQVGRLVNSGLIVLRTLPPTAAKSNRCINAIKRSECGRQVCKACAYLFTTNIGWVGNVSVVEYLDLVAGKTSERADLALQQRARSRGEDFLISWGSLFEDFGYIPNRSLSSGCRAGCACFCCGGGGDGHNGGADGDHIIIDSNGQATDSSYGTPIAGFFSAIDMSVSILLGWAAGVAAGRLSHEGCVLWLSVATFSTAFHTFVLLYYKPALVRGTQWFMSIASVLTTSTVALSFARYMTRSQYASEESFASSTVADKIMLAQASVGMLMVLVSAGFTVIFFIEFCDAWSTGNDLKELEKKTRQQLSLYSATGAASAAASTSGDSKNKSSINNRSGRQRLGVPNFDDELAILVSALHPRHHEEKDGDGDLEMGLLGSPRRAANASSGAGSPRAAKPTRHDEIAAALLSSPKIAVSPTVAARPSHTAVAVNASDGDVDDADDLDLGRLSESDYAALLDDDDEEEGDDGDDGLRRNSTSTSTAPAAASASSTAGRTTKRGFEMSPEELEQYLADRELDDVLGSL